MRGKVLFEEEVNDGIVSKYWIRQFSSGITELVINTVDKWVDYSLYGTHNGMGISVNIKDFDSDTPHKIHMVPIKFTKPSNTVAIEQQNKDQIAVYYIPYELLDVKVRDNE